MISSLTPTLSVTNSPVTYNASAQAATVTGSVAGVVSNVRYNGSATVPTNAATYAITADFVPTNPSYSSLTGASAGNFIINKANPTLSVSNSPVPYDGAAHAAAVTGSVPGSVSSILTGGAASQTAAGSYAVTANFVPTDATNYNSLTAAAAGNFVISSLTPTLSVTNSPVTYNASAQAATVTGSVAGVISNVRYNGSATVPTNAATYAITADFVPTNTANYSSLTAAAAGNFVITAIPVNGSCGTANGGSYSVAPSYNLCSAGTSSVVSGSGPWSWTCIGLYGGTTSPLCSAGKATNNSTTPAVIAGQPSGSYAGIKNGTTYSISRSEGGSPFNIVLSGTTNPSYTDTSALKPNTIYQYSVTSDVDSSQTAFMNIRTTLYNGWNIIAVPYATSGVNPATFFGSAVSAIYEWVPSGATAENSTTQLGSYVTVASLTPGKGYFVKTNNSATTLVYTGAAGPASATVTLKPGWTMIANPNTNNKTSIGTNWLIDGSALSLAITGNKIAGGIYWWNGSAYDSWSIIGANPIIEPWKGYWILNLDSVNHTLTIQ